MSRKRRRGGVPTFAALALFGAGVAVVASAPNRALAFGMDVRVNGHSVQLDSTHAKVGDAVLAAGIRPRVGLMRSVATGDPLPVGVHPARLWRDGVPVAANARVRSGDVIRVADGLDYMEPTVDQVQAVPAPGFPDVETAVWQGGQDGQVEDRVGRFSGEAAVGQVLQAPVAAAPAPGPVVLLTFDDGPDARWTPQVLDILKAKGVKAVFCMIGIQVEKFPDLVKRVHDEGMTLCDHTEHHDMAMSTKPDDYAVAEIDQPFNEIKGLTGTAPRFYRGPGGDLSPFIIGHAHGLGMRVLSWSVDPADYRRPGAQTIQDRIALNIRAGGVALMHDGGGDRSQTVEQLPGLIDRLRAEGYSIVAP